MNLGLLLFLLSPILMGYLLVQILLPAPLVDHANLPARANFFFRLCLAPGLGYALVSLLFFLWSLLFSPTRALAGYITLEGLVLLVLLVLAFGLRQHPSQPPAPDPGKTHLLGLALSLLATLVFSLFLLNFLNDWHTLAMDKPFGDYDAWAIWNLRAGFIASGDDWLKGFSSAILWSHPDYPLLLPLNVARDWVLLGQRSVFIPMLLGLIFQLSLVGLLVAAIALQRGWLQSLLAGVLGIAVIYVSLDFRQYADIPLAFYFLAANVLLYLGAASTDNNPGYTVLAGLSLGAALWTKNEGWMLLGATLVVSLLLALLSHKSFMQILGWFAWLFVGLIPFLIAALYFKFALAPPNDLLSELSLGAIKSKLVDLSRYLTIIKALRGQFFDYGNLAVPLIPLLLVYPLLSGFSLPKEELRAALGLFLRVTALAAIYFMIYLLTPKPLAWHLSTSLVRLLTQLFPSILLLYFLLVSPPLEENIARDTSNIESPPHRSAESLHR